MGSAFLQISLASLCLSLGTFLFLGASSKGRAKRVAIVALAILMPTLLASGVSLAAQGERGFLSNSQAMVTGCVFLILSVSLGYGIACLRHTLIQRLRSSKVGSHSEAGGYFD